ncbi:MAG: TraB/GumN family protein [Bacteroidetes bacterium]|nr:TraB/GumN family protein [Bacteroidota bacterium]
MRIILLLVLPILWSGVVWAQVKPEKQKGLLWEISGKGLKKPGYLYGTMHVSEKLVFNLSDSFFLALQQVDVVALETNHDSWQEFTTALSKLGRTPMEPGGSYGGGRFDYQNLYFGAFDFRAPKRETLAALLSAKPVMTNEFLYRSNLYQQDYEEDTYLDLFIFQAGKKLGKKVIGLENLEDSYESVMRARLPDANGNPNKAINYGPAGVSLETAYREQDLNLIDSINRLTSPGKNFQYWMLDKRNGVMAHGIDSILQHGQQIFAAVGAAHLPGESGVIQQLQKMGYQLRPVQFTDKKGTSDKEEIDQIRYPVQFSRNYLPDSSWSVETPGKLYYTAKQDGIEQYLSADMSNGAFYAIYRLKTNGWCRGDSPSYISDRIDSLIYEHIPGKIFVRKRFNDPFPGHEIMSRTRRGDVLRFKIMVNNYEVVVFSCGGNGNYAQGPEMDRFLGSIRHIQQGGTSNEMQPRAGGFRLTFPAPPTYFHMEKEGPNSLLSVCELPRDSSVFFIYKTDYHDFKYIEEDTFELNILGETISAQFSKSGLKSNLVRLSPYPTQDFSFLSDRNNAHYFMRLVIDGPFYYLLGCWGKSGKSPEAFFNSFEIMPFRYGDFEEIKDTVLHYTVQAFAKKPQAYAQFIDKLKRINAEIERKYREMGEGSEEYFEVPGDQYGLLNSPETHEIISVRVHPVRAGSNFPSLDSLKSDLRNDVLNLRSMHLQEEHWEEKNGILSGGFWITDTNSVRGIKVKYWVVNRKIYQLSANIPLNKAESGFVKTVFSSFHPSDSLDGSTLLGHNRDFLENIYSSDSLTRKAALETLNLDWKIHFSEDELPYVAKALENPQFNNLRFRDRRTLFFYLNQFHSPRALALVQHLYEKHQDSLRCQAVLLQVMAGMETRNALRVMIELIRKQPIYLDEEMEDIFGVLNDTLSLGAEFVPQLLEIAELDAFRERIYTLLERMVQQKQIKARDYRPLKPRLIRETSWAISQYQLLEEQNRDKSVPFYGNNQAEENIRDITRNLNLLAPFIRHDPDVRALCARLLRISNPKTSIFVYGLYLQQGLPVSLADLAPYRNKLYTHFILYQQLAKAGQLSAYAPWFQDTTFLIASFLVESQRVSGMFSQSGVDSVRLIGKYPYWANKRMYDLYFFDIRERGAKNWIMAQVSIRKASKIQEMPLQDNDGMPYGRFEGAYREFPMVLLLSTISEKDKTMYIRKKLGEMRFTQRLRYYAPQEENNYYPGY